MATHSSVLAWRIPGTGEPGGLPSMGSHRIGHNWRDLAAAAAAILYFEKPAMVFQLINTVVYSQASFSLQQTSLRVFLLSFFLGFYLYHPPFCHRFFFFFLFFFIGQHSPRSYICLISFLTFSFSFPSQTSSWHFRNNLFHIYPLQFTTEYLLDYRINFTMIS